MGQDYQEPDYNPYQQLPSPSPSAPPYPQPSAAAYPQGVPNLPPHAGQMPYSGTPVVAEGMPAMPAMTGTTQYGVQYTNDDQVVLLPTARNSARIFCPHCQRNVMTKIKRRPGPVACLCSALLCFVCWPCFWLPFCTRGCMDKVHMCPYCQNVLAVVPSAY